jgi:hypothetical protein
MILRKNISLNEEYLGKLEPLMQKHKGNLSAVIREVIDLADAAFQDPDSVKRLISGLRKEQNLTSSTLIWALRNLTGRLPDNETVNNIIGDSISSLSLLEKRLNELGSEIYWDSSIKIISDNDFQPGSATVSIDGKNPNISRFLAAVIAEFSAKKYNLGVSRIRTANGSFEMNLIKAENDWANKTVAENFGYLDFTSAELYRKPDFWNIIIPFYAKMNYDMVAIPGQLFEEILAAKTTPKLSICIERFCGCPINQIPPEELLRKITVLYKSTGLIQDMTIDKESLILHHGLSDTEAIKKLADMFVELLSSNGHTYGSTIGENLIVLRQLPEMGKILIRMVEDIKTNEDPVTDYHKDLLKMLNMLKNVPSNEDFIKSLGGKFGKKIIQSYEKDRKISIWDPSIFLKYMQEMSTILSQESKWSSVSENVICGKIATCHLVKGDAKKDNINCTFIKGLYDEWISHAFGKKIEKVHTMSHNASPENESCEIYVAFKS